MQLFAQNSAQNLFQRLRAMGNILTQCGVHKRLVVASARGVDLRAKPVQHVIVESYGDSGLAWRNRIDCAPPAAAEVVFLFHGSSSYRLCSERVAVRAEMMRIVSSPRHVYTTTSRRPNASMPMVIYR